MIETKNITIAARIEEWSDVADRMMHQLQGGDTDGLKDWWIFRGVTNANEHLPIPSIGRPDARYKPF